MHKLNMKPGVTAKALRSLFLISSVLVVLFVGNAFSQQPKKKQPAKSPVSVKSTERIIPKPARSSLKRPTSGDVSGPVVLVNSTPNDFLSGEVSVLVNPKQPTVIRLGLAQNAVSIVEFPASDGLYYIHEGNPKLASVFQSPTKETDRSITIYPGESFLPSRDGTTAAAISLQMRSGLVIILELVPVADLRKNAHRCVIAYDRDAVIAARRTAGLAYNLSGEDIAGLPVNSKAVSKLVSSTAPTESTEQPVSPLTSQPNIKAAYVDMTGQQARREQNNSKSKKKKEDISALANKKLAECLKDPKKNFKSWSKRQAGLEIAVSRTTELDEQKRLAVIAVRNATTSNLRLVPGSPELQIQTIDSTGNSVQSSRLESEYVETTAFDGLLPAGTTVYYALVYTAPILGVNQMVRVLVAHREAADVPVTATLGNMKSKE